MLKFIHLTDTHLVTPGQALYGTDPKWRLQRALAAINERHGDSRFMVVTGDLAHWGEPAAYAALSECLGQLRMPVHLLIGNHDDRNAFRAAFASTPVNSDGFVQYAFDADGIRHIMLDSNEPGVSWGVFCERRATWLADELARSAPSPVHLFIHHPPCSVGIPSMDRIALLEPGALREAVGPHRERIRHLFFGHLHRPLAGSWMGISLSTLRATNHQVALTLDDSPRILGSHEPAQFGVVLADHENTIVHLHDFEDASPRFEM